jgi:hypothetical protein
LERWQGVCHGVRQGRDLVNDGECGAEQLVYGGGLLDGSRDGDDGNSLGFCGPSDPTRSLPCEALGIEPTFAGDDEICGLHFPVKVEKLCDEIESGNERCVAERHEAECNAPRGTCAGDVGEIGAKLLACDTTDVSKRCFECGNF